METDDKQQGYFDLAFGLAYFLHADKEVAFFVAEDALDALATTLTRQEKNRASSDRLRGFLKWGERARPVRRTVRLGERQMLQWLVYRQSEPWERETERGEGLYLPSEEDLVVRYVKHLVFVALRRGSFYVTLAVASLLYQFSRRETRLFYDTLTQSDSARMKDAAYVGKQRLEMIERVSQRFGATVRLSNGNGGEKQFVTREADGPLVRLVHESLRRFAPWDTECAVAEGFEVTDIPGLYFSGPRAHDEEAVELTRIRAVLDPGCFALLAEGLSKYVRTLPAGDPDKDCDYDSPDARLRVPLFSNYPQGPTRGDRLRPPELTQADYVRLRRALEARARRRRDFTPKLLRVYVDDVLRDSFGPSAKSSARLRVGPEACLVEVRGVDDACELTLATLFLEGEQIREADFAGSVVLEGGQKVGARLARAAGGRAGEGALLEVSYRDARRLVWWRTAGSVVGGGDAANDRPAIGLRSVKSLIALAVAALLIVVTALVWRRSSVRTSGRAVTPAGEIAQSQTGQEGGARQEAPDKPIASSSSSSSPSRAPTPPAAPPPSPVQPRDAGEAGAQVASAAWDVSREAALLAVPVEATRAESRALDLRGRVARVSLSVPRYADGGSAYTRYRVTLSAKSAKVWRMTLRAPRAGGDSYAHVLSVSLFTKRLGTTGDYDLQVEGFGEGHWNLLGGVRLSPKGR
jgi:hypothetical protein